VTIRQTRTGMRFELEFEDTFDGDDLETTHWLPYYLPHWSSRERSAARYVVRDGLLRLRIEEDQKPWCPELDGELRVSSLQTGELAGPVGSTVGQHRFSDAAVVREQQPTVRLYTPLYGRIELRARANDDPRAMVALWMIRYDEPERSSEICVCEIFGREMGEDSALVGVGVHPFGDERIVDDFSKVRVEIDARDFHVYAVEWTPDDVTFFVDDTVIKTVDQSPDYPMQLLLNIYEFPGEPSGPYPKEFIVDYVRGYRLTTA
jgi:Glycosyl hydrolases family 16